MGAAVPNCQFGASGLPRDTKGLVVVDSRMAFSAADLQMVDDHIALGERHVLRQRELLAWLQSKGHPTEIAEDLLEEFESTLEQHRAHRAQMVQDVEADPLAPSRRAPAPRKGTRGPKKD